MMKQFSNNIDEATLLLAEEIGGCFFSAKEAAEMLDVPEELLLDTSEPLHQRYRKGWLQSEFDLRKCILKLAVSGSSPAQAMAMDIQQKAKLKSLD